VEPVWKMRTLIVLKEYFIRTLSGMVWEQQFEVVAGRHDPIHSADPFGPAGNPESLPNLENTTSPLARAISLVCGRRESISRKRLHLRDHIPGSQPAQARDVTPIHR